MVKIGNVSVTENGGVFMFKKNGKIWQCVDDENEAENLIDVLRNEMAE